MLVSFLDLRFAKQAMNVDRASLTLLRPAQDCGLKSADFKKVNSAINLQVDRIKREGIDLLQGETVEEVSERTLAY